MIRRFGLGLSAVLGLCALLAASPSLAPSR